jgi:hypothetical protein
MPRFARLSDIDFARRHDAKITCSISWAAASRLASHSRAARPATCGVAIDEPSMLW